MDFSEIKKLMETFGLCSVYYTPPRGWSFVGVERDNVEMKNVFVSFMIRNIDQFVRNYGLFGSVTFSFVKDRAMVGPYDKGEFTYTTVSRNA